MKRASMAFCNFLNIAVALSAFLTGGLFRNQEVAQQ